MTDWPDYPGALAENPQAAAVAQRIKAEQGFDPLDPATLDQAVREYRTSRRRAVRWASVLGFPLALVLIGAIIAITGGPIAGGLFVLMLGALLSWFPALKMARAYQQYLRARPVIQRYEDVLRAAQPDPHRGRAAINRWRRDHGLM